MSQDAQPTLDLRGRGHHHDIDTLEVKTGEQPTEARTRLRQKNSASSQLDPATGGKRFEIRDMNIDLWTRII
ncbi:hypothetical protein [Nocardia sp. CS682]|uniref:hypothetical protein n=1 Tax=Nocardia sp. CS682 TaxID=1047172 RepID=UPI0010752480|nr:hypothetical protein [Nocardia sp. CS682]QBS41324.1 hypothetical protein DMB37_15535 [Nocardia sp. CS682]